MGKLLLEGLGAGVGVDSLFHVGLYPWITPTDFIVLHEILSRNLAWCDKCFH